MSRDKRFVAVSLVPDSAARSRLERAFRGDGSITFCSSLSELIPLARAHRPTLAVVAPRDATGNKVAPAVEALHAAWPGVRIVVYARLELDDVHELPALGRAGATGLVFRDIDDLGPALRDLLVGIERRDLTPGVGERLLDRVPAVARPVFTYCLRHCHERLSVIDVADAFGLTRRTLVNRLSRSTAPPPATIVTWCRLVVAACALQDPRRTVRGASRAAGFCDASAFRRVLRSHAGLQPSALRLPHAPEKLITRMMERSPHRRGRGGG